MNKIGIALRGMAMGIAEIIPGVSGGTIALITGIYEKLILTIKMVDLELLSVFRKQGFSGVWKHLDGNFLVSLLSGMLLGVVVGVFGVTYLFEHYPEPLWGFFFGLIVASCIYIARQIPRWRTAETFALLLGILVAYGITIVSPAEGSSSYLYLFFSGVLAISALILPGISGSFILLLLGMYTVVIPTLRNFLAEGNLSDFIVLVVFGLGCLVGLFSFARVMSYLFKKFKWTTLATLTGFMIGSLNKIWPWRNVSEILIRDIMERKVILAKEDVLSLPTESFKVMSETNVLPSAYWMGDPKTMLTIFAVFLGVVLVLLFDKMSGPSTKTDIRS